MKYFVYCLFNFQYVTSRLAKFNCGERMKYRVLHNESIGKLRPIPAIPDGKARDCANDNEYERGRNWFICGNIPECCQILSWYDQNKEWPIKCVYTTSRRINRDVFNDNIAKRFWIIINNDRIHWTRRVSHFEINLRRVTISGVVIY